MSGSIRLGMLTPSSNTVLEPVSSAIAACMANVSVHFARFRVTEIALDPSALQQFRHDPMLDAATLLADAKVDAIAWNGTSGSWLGFDMDRSLCAAITERTGSPASSATLALDAQFRMGSVERFGLVTPYIPVVQDQIIRTYAGEGYTCVAERHFGLRDNFSFASTPPATIAAAIRDVAASRPQAIVVLCTNLAGAGLVEELEAETGIPIYDSVAVSVWGALRACGVMHPVTSGWGRLFRQ
jgi:maleate isomerase